MNSLWTRVIIVVLILLAGRFATAARDLNETKLSRPLSGFPLELDDWRGVEGPPFDQEAVRVLRADDYVNRVFEHPTHGAVALYVGYYGSQRQGDSIHSPRNCLPGSGWQPVSHTRSVIDTSEGTLQVNRYVVERRGERQLVLYWFQGRGRTTASEYVNKAHLLYDALRLGRTDGAVVRVIAPLSDTEKADAAVQEFVRALQPQLTRWLP